MGQTMRVRLTTGRVWEGPDGKSLAAKTGDEIEVDTAEARRLLESDQATPVATLPGQQVEKRRPGRPRKNPIVEVR